MSALSHNLIFVLQLVLSKVRAALGEVDNNATGPPLLELELARNTDDFKELLAEVEVWRHLICRLFGRAF